MSLSHGKYPLMVLEKEHNPWKKSEDEILKKGIAKYGTNKWNKICNLLKRTPLECKSRYNDYILGKKEWTTHDTEKLMSIAQHLQPQWKLIGNIMARSEQDCYDKYISTIYKDMNVSKYDEVAEATEEYDNEAVNCAMDQLSKHNRKRL